MRHWLMKSEPGVYSIDDLQRDGRTHWEGVRNYQARNFMRDDMQPGDRVLFHHSNADPTGIAGLARIATRGYPDLSALDPASHYYDEKPTRAGCWWTWSSSASSRAWSRWTSSAPRPAWRRCSSSTRAASPSSP